ncbi:MAG: cytochrome c maturation protein CcmE [Dehalococcoidales bacterium]
MRKRGRWLLVAAVVLAVGLSYVAYSLFIHSGADYLTVSELKSQVESLPDQQVRVGGKVAPGSIDWDDKAQVMRFALTDDKESLTIVYEGIVPDSFKPGADLVVEGRYRPDDVFQALSFGSRRSICNLCH